MQQAQAAQATEALANGCLKTSKNDLEREPAASGILIK